MAKPPVRASSVAVGRYFVDTWGWLVLANDRDPAHRAVRDLRSRTSNVSGAWVTSDYVMDETITRLFSARPHPLAKRFCSAIFEASQAGLLHIERITPERFTAAWHLRVQFDDKSGISFTDLTSFVVMRELGIANVVTGDAHFQQAGFGFHLCP